MARTLPVLLGLLWLVRLLAHRQWQQGKLSIGQAAWHVKERATFSDAIACVRRQLWSEVLFGTCSAKTDIQELQQALLERFADTLCYAARLDKV